MRYTIRTSLAVLAVTLGALLASAAAADDITYTYDALGRLESATYPSKGPSEQTDSVAYTYDAAGNRLEVQSEVVDQLLPIDVLMILLLDQ